MSSNQPTNFYTIIPKRFLPKSHNPHYDRHKISIPGRVILCGGSGSGKTNCLLYLLEQMPNTFGKIVVCLRTRHEPLYEYLAYKIPSESIEFYENTVPDLDQIIKKEDESINTLCVFDDLVMGGRDIQNKISEYFLRGRKKNCSCVYISQSYHAIPKFVRLQASAIILKKISSMRDLRLILRDSDLGVDADELQRMYEEATQTFTDFFTIDLAGTPDTRFRKGLYECFSVGKRGS